MSTLEAWTAWQQKPVYTVGPATAEAARRLGLSPLGEQGGSAENLAEFISNQHQNLTKPLLFLCGNLRRHELPAILHAQEIPFEESVVYHTVPQEDLDLEPLEPPDYAVFFSPSGVQAIYPQWPKNWKETKCVAIGNRTAEALSRTNLNLASTAKSPTPQSLLKPSDLQPETRNPKPETIKGHPVY